MEALQRKESVTMTPEEIAREGVYGFLARVLCRAATAAENELMAPMAGSETPLNQAVAGFLKDLAGTSEADIERHYHDLFSQMRPF